MDIPQRSEEISEPPGSQETPVTQRKFSPTIAGMLRDAKDTIRVSREHSITLPLNASIEGIHDEATLHIDRLLNTGDGGGIQVRFSFNGSALATEKRLGKGEVKEITTDLQDAVEAMPSDISGLRLISLAQETLGDLQTAVLHERPSMNA